MEIHFQTKRVVRLCFAVFFFGVPSLGSGVIFSEKAESESSVECEALSLSKRALKKGEENPEKEEAYWKLKRLSENGCAEATYALIPFYMGGHGPADVNEEYAVELARTSAKNGFVQAQLQMGKFYLWGYDGLSKDGESAVGWFRRAAENGSSTAMWNLIEIYRSGKLGVERDLKRAEYWEKKRESMGAK